MLSEKPWKREVLLMLGACWLMCLSLGMLAGQLLQWALPAFAKQHGEFLRFLVGSLAFQGTALVLSHFMLKLHEITWSEFLGLGNGRWRNAMNWGLMAVAAALPIALGLNKVSALLLKWILNRDPDQQAVVTIIQKTASIPQQLWYGIAAIILAPLIEEILFRGVLYSLLRQRSGVTTSILASSLLFAAIHFNMLTFLPLMFFAMVLAWVYEKTDALLAPIVAHACFNAVNYLMLLMVPKQNHTIGLWL